MTSQAVKNVRTHFYKGKTIGETIKLSDELGVGSYGVVFRAQKPNGTTCAVKILSKKGATDFALTAIEREMNLLIKVNHCNVIRVSRVEATRDSAILEMECADGPVSDLIDGAKGSNLQKHILTIFRGLLDALLHLHNIKIAHRDIKHDNMLYKYDKNGGLRIMLCDFGMSVNIEEVSGLWPALGSPAYRSPELVDGRRLDYIPFAADIWALSITLYVLLTCDAPWGEAREMDTAYRRYLMDPRSIFENQRLCKPVEELILRGLNHDPKLRPNIHTFRAAFVEIKELWVNESPKRSLTPDVGETVAKRLRTSGGDECACCGEASVTGLIYPFEGQWENHWVCGRCLQSGKETSLISFSVAYTLGLRKGDICRHLRQLVIEKGCDASVPAFLIKGPHVVISTSEAKSLVSALYHELLDGKPMKAALEKQRNLHRAYISQLQSDLYVRLSNDRMRDQSKANINAALTKLFKNSLVFSHTHTLANGLTVVLRPRPPDNDEEHCLVGFGMTT